MLPPTTPNSAKPLVVWIGDDVRQCDSVLSLVLRQATTPDFIIQQLLITLIAPISITTTDGASVVKSTCDDTNSYTFVIRVWANSGADSWPGYTPR